MTNKPKQGKQPTQRNKKKKRPVKIAGPSQIVPAYLYISACCGVTGIKKPLVRDATVRPNDRTTYSENHLGVFRCSNCKQHSKFKRIQNKDGETVSI